MKKLIPLLLYLSCFFYACHNNTPEAFESDQAEVQEKLEAIQQLIKKYDLPDSVYHNIARMKEDKVHAIKQLDLQVLEEQLASWAAFKQKMAPHQEIMNEMSETHRKAWAEIEAETDPEKKAALEEKYWKDIFPVLEQKSKAIDAQLNNQK